MTPWIYVGAAIGGFLVGRKFLTLEPSVDANGNHRFDADGNILGEVSQDLRSAIANEFDFLRPVDPDAHARAEKRAEALRGDSDPCKGGCFAR